jgi:acetylornithine deacetylase
MTDAELLALHREIVAIPSLSHHERPLSDHLEAWLRSRGVAVSRFGDNIFAAWGRGPLVCFNTHLDTVPPAPGWTHPPHTPAVVDGRVYGLGSNDAKASVAAMIAAFVRLRAQSSMTIRILLTLVVEEESGGKGSEALVPELFRLNIKPDAVIVGEPTSLQIAVAQKGLLILELTESGRACHAAHGRALGAHNALRRLAADLIAVDSVDLGPAHPDLGPPTVEPTFASGGTAQNIIPATASCILDVRTNPGHDHREITERLRAAVAGEITVVSDHLTPCAINPDHLLVRAARQARPASQLFGSRGVSDLVFFSGIPAIKAGPGASERSHTPDEFVLESEIIEGARFYEALALAYGALVTREGFYDTALGSR